RRLRVIVFRCSWWFPPVVDVWFVSGYPVDVYSVHEWPVVAHGVPRFECVFDGWFRCGSYCVSGLLVVGFGEYAFWLSGGVSDGGESCREFAAVVAVVGH